jgi:hypothetical protein
LDDQLITGDIGVRVAGSVVEQATLLGGLLHPGEYVDEPEPVGRNEVMQSAGDLPFIMHGALILGRQAYVLTLLRSLFCFHASTFQPLEEKTEIKTPGAGKIALTSPGA